ncbi:Reverse transcriptase domain-containing protein [Mycena venus]|uniref:Reverse transcriptase domain-containing protein n=1 Tax=Mycena venus TaxID=2733690 RepID=A0A8H6XUA6_9AGAR|nr:Reverse transcriptase domain-containing protein [Mycena venus]
MARVDCYLISGCELSLDTDSSLLQDHMDVQHLFLRRLLGLNPHSMLAILFTETGQMPLRVRRLLLALGRLLYLVRTDPRRVVHSAFLDSIALMREGKAEWASDLSIMLKRLLTAIEVTPDDLMCPDTIQAITKQIVSIVDQDLQNDIDHLVRTHLLRNRLELGESRSLTLVPRRLRHYLTSVHVPAHRKAMTGLLLGDHNLSVERLRYPARYREAIPRQHRLCRLCLAAVEDEVHALFDCTAELRLVQLRSQFLEALRERDPVLGALYGKISNYDFLLKLVSSRKAVQQFAKHIYLTLRLFEETPRYFPVAFRIPG